jgi:hypothetical protein
MQYAMLLAHDESLIVGTHPERAAAFNALAQQLGSRIVASIRLRPTETATTVRVADGDVVIADGPFAETKEQIAGVIVVECDDLDDAIDVAVAIPTARFGVVEVRPLWTM